MMRRPVRSLAALAVGAVLVVGVALNSGQSNVAHGDQMPPAEFTTTTFKPGEAPAREPKLAEQLEGPLEELERQAAAAFGADHAGVWREEDGSTYVGVVGEQAAVQAVFHEATTVGVEHSLAELDEYRSRLDEASESLITGAGIKLASWWVDPSANTVQVEVIGGQEDLAAAAAAIEKAVGPGPVTLTAVAGGARQMSRITDSDPHSGGAKIYNAYATCASGLYWFKPPSTLQMATSGHCIEPASIWVTTADWYGVTGTSWNGMDGTGSNHVDAAMITLLSTGQGYFYVGPPTGTGLVQVTYADGGSHSGLTGLRVSGPITGESQVGSGVVRAVNVTVAFYEGGVYTDTRYGLNRADCWGSAGDSGAPVFRVLSGGYISAMGIFVATIEDIGDQCYYTPVATITSKYGGGVAG